MINDLLTQLKVNFDFLVSEDRKVIQTLLEALKSVEFGFLHRRCSVCAGWKMSEFGETDMVHTDTCPIALAIKQAEEYLKP